MKQGWKIERLGDLCDIITKGTTPTTLGFSFVDSGVNFVKIESINETGVFLPNKLAHVTQECHDSFKRSQLAENDILFSIAGALGRVALVTKDILPANTNQALAIIRLSNIQYTLPPFVVYCLKSKHVYDQINKFKAGVAQLNLSLEQIRELRIPVPPLLEQQRIVALLDEAFAALTKVHANAERNQVNARDMFDTVAREIFENKGDDWDEKRINEVCELKSGTTIPVSLERPEGDVLYTKIADMNRPGNLIEIHTSSRFVNSNEIKQNQIIPEGAIIFPKRGGAIATNKKRKIIKPTIVDLNTMAIIPSNEIDLAT